MKGLTLSVIFEAFSLNYGESMGNITSLKKIIRGDGKSYTYISRQALRYNIIRQMKEDSTELSLDGSVIQFAPEASIEDYPEIDLFGYMKTSKVKAFTRSAVVRLSNGVSLESYNGDLDFLTNKGLFDRYKMQTDIEKSGGNIAQNEIHKSYYTYTLTMDLDKVGIDVNDNIEIETEEKIRRVNKLLDTIKFLYRDIKGRREDLKPIFAIGGVYPIKNPFFENKLKVKNNKVNVKILKDILNLDDNIKCNTYVGLLHEIFQNDDEIHKELNALEMKDFFDKIKEKVQEFYEIEVTP